MRRILVSGLALAIAGCGGGGSGGGTAVTPPPTSTPPPTTPTPATPPTAASRYVPAAAARATTGVALPLGKCVNLGNMLDPPNEGDWGRRYEDEDARLIAEAGFATVRVPIRFSAHALPSPPYTIDPAFMARVRHVVDTMRAQNLNVIIDLHHYEELFANPEAHTERLAGLWRQIAAEFRTYPTQNVWFEIINEAHGNLTNPKLPALYALTLAAIRETNPTRPVIVGGEGYGSITGMLTVTMPNDPYIVPTFHTYDPFNFTHQGASFVQPVLPTGVTFGSQADLDALDRELKRVKDWMTQTGRVPFLGEYGAFDDVPLEQRKLYYEVMSEAFASIGVQSCAWSYANTFPLRVGNAWVPGLKEVIATTTTRE